LRSREEERIQQSLIIIKKSRRKIISIQFTSKLMVMSSFLMNSSPAAYGSADPKFPPTEEYSQGNYIPDYYASQAAAAAAGHSTVGQVVSHHPYHPAHGHHHPHYGYHHPHHHPNYGSASLTSSTTDSSGGLNSYGHPSHHHHPHSSSLHSHLATQQSYYNSDIHGPGSHVPSPHSLPGLGSSLSHQSISSSTSSSLRVPSPETQKTTPSPPRSQEKESNSGLADPPSPGDCGESGSDSGLGSKKPTVKYPWMKSYSGNKER